MRASVGPEPALVVATCAEPVAFGGYAAALLLDADKMLRLIRCVPRRRRCVAG